MGVAFEHVGGTPERGSSLDQLNLRNGDEVVRDYIRHGEASLALEHMIYMVKEPPLGISGETYRCIEEAGDLLEMDPHLWQDLIADGA